MGHNQKDGDYMKFLGIIRERENAEKVVSFMKGIYSQAGKECSKPIDMYVITDDVVSYGIVVASDHVISALEEDRGIAPTEPWNLYTFMDLMRGAGYVMDKMAPGSNIALFTNTKEATHCSVCSTDCKYTGLIVDIPIYIGMDHLFVPVRMCTRCREQFIEELNALVDIRADKPCEDKNTNKKPKGFFRRFIDKLMGR